jgi:serine/threonine-protein kinase
VVSPSQSAGLLRVEATGGTPKELTRLDEAAGERSHRWPQTLPGGRHVLVTVALEDEAFDEARLELVSLETGERRLLVTGGAYGRYVSTGHIVFSRGGHLLAVPFDLERLAVRGSPTVVTEGVRYDPRNGGTHVAVSANGTLVYTPGALTSPDHHLAWLGIGGDVVQITETPRAFRELRLSPDARHVALVLGRGMDSDLWVLDLASRTLSQLTFGLNTRRPVWTTDGRSITFATLSPPTFRLASVSREGGAAVTLLESDLRTYPNVWHPDGQTLVYQTQSAATGWDLFAARLDPAGRLGEGRALVASPYNEANADLSSDGRFLAYESNELDDVYEVYVRPLEGGVKVRATKTGARWPRFGPPGRLFYWYSFRSDLQQIDFEARRDRLVMGPARLVFPPRDDTQDARIRRMTVRAQYESYDFDVSRQRFLVLESASPPEPPLQRPVVVLNWGQELRTLAPSR